jgi:hypothetical protein
MPMPSLLFFGPSARSVLRLCLRSDTPEYRWANLGETMVADKCLAHGELQIWRSAERAPDQPHAQRLRWPPKGRRSVISACLLKDFRLLSLHAEEAAFNLSWYRVGELEASNRIQSPRIHRGPILEIGRGL